MLKLNTGMESESSFHAYTGLFIVKHLLGRHTIQAFLTVAAAIVHVDTRAVVVRKLLCL